MFKLVVGKGNIGVGESGSGKVKLKTEEKVIDSASFTEENGLYTTTVVHNYEDFDLVSVTNDFGEIAYAITDITEISFKLNILEQDTIKLKFLVVD